MRALLKNSRRLPCSGQSAFFDAEKIIAEKIIAEKNKTIIWPLSEKEKNISQTLN